MKYVIGDIIFTTTVAINIYWKFFYGQNRPIQIRFFRQQIKTRSYCMGVRRLKPAEADRDLHHPPAAAAQDLLTDDGHERGGDGDFMHADLPSNPFTLWE